MWPIVKKELRENARYLLGAFVIVLLFVDFDAFDGGWVLLGIAALLKGQPPDWANAGRYSLDAGQIAHTWQVACLLLAGAIALGQNAHEKRRKTWPLLAHLPITRTRMIFAKVLAGLLMYLIVSLPVGLLIVVRLNTPGVWPGPVCAYMFLPLLCYFLSDAMFYLAMFLASFRPARWYATKFFPLLAALPAFFVASRADWFLHRPFYFAQYGRADMMILHEWRVMLVLALLSLAFVLWAIREQARTREY